MDDGLKQSIISLREEGKSGYEIVEILREKKVSKSSVYRVLQKAGFKSFDKMSVPKYFLNDDYFSKIDTQEKAYWFGFLCADGYLVTDTPYVGVTQHSDDKYHVEKFKAEIETNAPIHDYLSATGFSNESPYSRLIVNSPKMKSDLINNGMGIKKSTTLQFPNCIPAKLLFHFIRGYFDGDGSISYDSCSDAYQIKLCGTENFLREVLRLFEKPELSLFKRHKNDIDQFYFSIGGNRQVEKLLDVMYKDSIIHLERKFNRYNDLKARNSRLAE